MNISLLLIQYELGYCGHDQFAPALNPDGFVHLDERKPVWMQMISSFRLDSNRSTLS